MKLFVRIFLTQTLSLSILFLNLDFITGTVINRSKQKHIHINTLAINIKQAMTINFKLQNSHTYVILFP
jgi:hypothetical protein